MTMQVFCHNGSCHYAKERYRHSCDNCDILDQVEFDENRIDRPDEFLF